MFWCTSQAVLNLLPLFCSLQVSLISFFWYYNFSSTHLLCDLSSTSLNSIFSTFVFRLLSMSWSFPFRVSSRSILSCRCFQGLFCILLGSHCIVSSILCCLIQCFQSCNPCGLFLSFVFMNWLLVAWFEGIGKELASPALADTPGLSSCC